MTTISAKTILRSRNSARPDKVLSTLLLRYPRWIHAEQRTHRLIPLGEELSFDWPTPSLMADENLSRNAASSRAIPVKKLIDDVLSDPAVPLFWGKNQKGMQASEEHDESVWYKDYNDGTDCPSRREAAWLAAMGEAIRFARAFDDAGYHKQIVNRLLEPFSHITTLVSATEWSNFLELRDHPDAEPHIAMLAREIRKCLDDESTIQTLQPGEWHAPFVDSDNDPEFGQFFTLDGETIPWKDAIKLSVARNASTSYKTVDGFDMTLDRAIALHDKLVAAKPAHASPAEHVAEADEFVVGVHYRGWKHPHQHGNFSGFRQYRHML